MTTPPTNSTATFEAHSTDSTERLWRLYKTGYDAMVRSGFLFKEVLRYMMTPIVVNRAAPLLVHYARANYRGAELPPDFEAQLEVCGLTVPDLVHLDYAISMGHAETSGIEDDAPVGPVPALEWTSSDLHNILFAYADITGARQPTPFFANRDIDENEDPEGGGPGPRFDL